MNSCPMFTFTERDIPRTPPPARAHALTKPDSLLENSDDDDLEPLATVNITIDNQRYYSSNILIY
jgi:hypothetical protein